ncbi:MAG: hypothetical protein HY696_12225 [Deltaproteobacteria bacterium]|nr:hypothetical protein [Deltaproteobacteria bacterium]
MAHTVTSLNIGKQSFGMMHFRNVMGHRFSHLFGMKNSPDPDNPTRFVQRVYYV